MNVFQEHESVGFVVGTEASSSNRKAVAFIEPERVMELLQVNDDNFHPYSDLDNRNVGVVAESKELDLRHEVYIDHLGIPIRTDVPSFGDTVVVGDIEVEDRNTDHPPYAVAEVHA
jgi:hypothetical protein